MTGKWLYILVDKRPVATDDIEAWGRAMQNDRHVARTEVAGLVVSTVFMGIDHAFDESEPILFESMIFDTRESGLDRWKGMYQTRSATWEQAEAMHKEACDFAAEVAGKDVEAGEALADIARAFAAAAERKS